MPRLTLNTERDQFAYWRPRAVPPFGAAIGHGLVELVVARNGVICVCGRGVTARLAAPILRSRVIS